VQLGRAPDGAGGAMRRMSEELPDGMSFSVHKGCISVGGNLLEETCTIEEAKIKASKLAGCKGFCFRETDDMVAKIFFKDHWDVIDASPYGFSASKEPWTSYKMDTEATGTKSASVADDWLKAELEGVPMPEGSPPATSAARAKCGGESSWWFRLTHGAYNAIYSLGFGLEYPEVPTHIKDIYDIQIELITEREHTRVAGEFPDAAKLLAIPSFSLACLRGRVGLIVNAASK